MQINYAKKQISCKLVYYGPGMSGKTTNLEVVHEKVPEHNKGEMTSISTEGDRTLFFDFLPLDLGKVRGMTTKFQLYTVPGQVYYASTRKLVLQGADGVIFVADSQKDKVDENNESLRDLEKNFREYGMELSEIPLVIQWNKRDLPNAMDIDELEEKVNWVGAPTTTAVAATGEGVLGTLKLAASMILDRLNTGETGAMIKKASKKKPASPPESRKEVYVAKVNSDKISKSYFIQYCQAQYRLSSNGDNVKDFKKFTPEEKHKLLESLLNHVLLLHDAKRRKIQATKDEVKTKLADFTRRFNSSEDLDDYLARRKLNMDNLRNEAIKNVIISKVIKIAFPDVSERMRVTDQEVMDYYEANVSRFEGKPLDEVKSRITAKLKQKRKRALLNEFFADLRKNARIKLFNENI